VGIPVEGERDSAVKPNNLTSQLPFSRWHEQIGDPTIADGVLDRLVHNAHRIRDARRVHGRKRNLPQDEKKE
jgi:DNA replication protein DnaC